jgi:hypothetical protein
MFLLDWYREYKSIKLDSQVCQTCEALKLELAKAHDLNHELLQTLTTKSEAPAPPVNQEFKPITPKRHLTFAMRRQMLEAEDKIKAKLIAEQQAESKTIAKDLTKNPLTSASTTVDSNLTDELELELDIVANEREKEKGVA